MTERAKIVKNMSGAAVTMRVAIDLSAIKTGGGVQRAITFLKSLEDRPWDGAELHLILPPTGPLATYRSAHAVSFVNSPPGWLARTWFEYLTCQRYLRSHGIDVIFTFFGAGLPHPRSVRSVVGVAYPIICYPDSPYWRHLRTPDRWRQQGKNLLRVLRLRAADAIVAETDVMADRLARVLRTARNRIHVIAPTPTDYVDDVRPSRAGPFVFLFLSGLSPHKNLWRLHDVAEALAALTSEPFVFLVTCDRRSFIASLKSAPPARPDVIERCFEFAGATPQSRIGDLYRRSDCLVNLSDLESFSNNYMEAWRAGIPQVASDRDFARSICADSAVYAEPHAAASVAGAMLQVMRDADLRARLVLAGRRLLERLPTQMQATERLGRILRR